MTDILICSLGVYGASVLVSEYDGPFDVFRVLRAKLAALRCVPCASVWIAAPLAYFTGIGVTGYLAAIGLVLLAERLTP